MHTISLQQFERIDGHLSLLLRMGEFESCADPRAYIATSNRLFDACVDAMGFAWVNDFVSAEEAAAAVITTALLSSSFVREDV